MGFDTYARYKEVEIAYLRRNFAHPNKHRIFRLLDATELAGAFSGYGEEQEFTKNKIKAALDKCAEDDDLEGEFLKKCHDRMESNEDKITIYFG